MPQTLSNELSKFKKGPHLRESFLSIDLNPFGNQLSIALWLMTLIWHVTDTQRRADVSVGNPLHLLFSDSDEGLWHLDTELFDDQMTEWRLDCWWPEPLIRLIPGPDMGHCPHTWEIISQPYTVVLLLSCVSERFGWNCDNSSPAGPSVRLLCS